MGAPAGMGGALNGVCRFMGWVTGAAPLRRYILVLALLGF